MLSRSSCDMVAVKAEEAKASGRHWYRQQKLNAMRPVGDGDARMCEAGACGRVGGAGAGSGGLRLGCWWGGDEWQVAGQQRHGLHSDVSGSLLGAPGVLAQRNSSTGCNLRPHPGRTHAVKEPLLCQPAYRPICVVPPSLYAMALSIHAVPHPSGCPSWPGPRTAGTTPRHLTRTSPASPPSACRGTCRRPRGCSSRGSATAASPAAARQEGPRPAHTGSAHGGASSVDDQRMWRK